MVLMETWLVWDVIGEVKERNASQPFNAANGQAVDFSQKIESIIK